MSHAPLYHGQELRSVLGILLAVGVAVAVSSLLTQWQ